MVQDHRGVRRWFERSAMADLLGEDFGLVQSDKLYRCLDKLVAHKQALFDVRFDVLLYDLTSTVLSATCRRPASGSSAKPKTSVPTASKW